MERHQGDARSRRDAVHLQRVRHGEVQLRVVDQPHRGSTAAARSLYGDRRDWAATAGLTQILNANAQVQTNLAYTRSEGYLSNPYKLVEVAFIDPEQQFLAPSPDVLYVERRTRSSTSGPTCATNGSWNIRYAQYIDAADAGLHLNYAYFRDDWGIRAQRSSVEWAQPFGNGWMLTPMVRYYTQTAADFYTPYLVTDQGQSSTRTDPVTGQHGHRPVRSGQVAAYYSSDYRLSAFGTLGGGFTLSKEFCAGA